MASAVILHLMRGVPDTRSHANALKGYGTSLLLYKVDGVRLMRNWPV